MEAIDDLRKAIGRITTAAETLQTKHANCPTHEDVQAAADALNRLADKLEKAAEPAAPAAT